MVLNTEILLAGFVLGLSLGVSVDLINKLVSAFARWALSR
jgi:hypothetical protein